MILNKKKRTCWILDFAVLADFTVELKECEKRDKYLDLARELKKKLWNMKVTIMPIVIGTLGSHQRIGTRTGRLENNGTGGNCPNYSIVEIDQNTEKSPGNLRTLVVTQTPVRNHQLKLVWNLEKEVNNCVSVWVCVCVFFILNNIIYACV